MIKNSAFIWRVKQYGNIQQDGYLVGHKLTEWSLCDPLTQWFLDNTTIEDDTDYRLADFELEDFKKWLDEELKHPESYAQKDFTKMIQVQHDCELAHKSFGQYFLYQQY